MNLLIDHYFLFSTIFGILVFLTLGLNLYYKFTDIPFFQSVLKSDKTDDMVFNIMVIGLQAFFFSLVWPIALIVLIIFLLIYYC